MINATTARLMLTVALAACGRGAPLVLPTPHAPKVDLPTGSPLLSAGVGRVDITPPVGLGLSGNGTEGRRSQGYRTRLYARALVLQDGTGERVAFVVADLPHVSAILHRQTAERLLGSSALGADRLVLSATHTHSGPGHFYDGFQLNDVSSRVPGYDSTVVDFLVTRFAAAVDSAVRSLRPARVAWDTMSVWGHTRNRSYAAYRRNSPERATFGMPPAHLDPSERAVNPLWTMLRVEVREDTLGAYRVAGALSVFAIHPTGNSAENELYDADIHAQVERGVERHIDAVNARRGFPPTPSVHLFANGTEGDVSPNWPPQSRCPVPLLRPVRRPAGPRTPDAWGWDHGPAESVARCDAAARAYTNAVGDTLTARAILLFDRLGEGAFQDSLRIGVAFRTLDLREDYKRLEICDRPKIGTSTTAGAADSRSRYGGLRLFGLLPLGLEEGGRAARRHPTGCHAEKNLLLAGFTPAEGFPGHAQLSVVRIGDLLMGTVPAEPTTMVGAHIMRSMRVAAESHGLPARGVVVLALTNGFLNYVTTAAEYTAQHYEGGSTLYGPGEAALFARELGRLSADLARTGGSSPDNEVLPIEVHPGKRVELVPPKGAREVSREVLSLECGVDTLVARWRDVHSSRFGPPPGPVLRWRHGGGQVQDDDRYVEVRFTGDRNGTGWIWESRWTPRAHAKPYGFEVLGPGGGTVDARDCDEAAGQSLRHGGTGVRSDASSRRY